MTSFGGWASRICGGFWVRGHGDVQGVFDVEAVGGKGFYYKGL